jgi:molybdopterin-guanine dinucleotide biosynthesis protein B
MKLVGFCGSSGAGKTTLIEGVIAALKAAGQRVSVIKHAHHRFDIDHPGKDTWRHRKAGAGEVLIASRHRLALMREFEHETEMGVHDLVAELRDCDWVIVEGFKQADMPKIEVWRAEVSEPPRYPDDGFVIAVATDDPARLPVPTERSVLPLNDPPAVARWLLESGSRHEYSRPV